MPGRKIGRAFFHLCDFPQQNTPVMVAPWLPRPGDGAWPMRNVEVNAGVASPQTPDLPANATQTGVEQRRHRRYALSLPVHLRSKKKSEAAVLASSKDISAEGIYFTMPKGFRLGSTFEFDLVLPMGSTQGHDVRIRGIAEIVRVDRKGLDAKVGVAALIHKYQFIRK
jgi:hypothetical protein